MTQTTWDPSDTGGWVLSNGDLTATSPDNNTKQSIFVTYGTTAIPNNAETYYEFKVSGAAILTAFTVGFSVRGADVSNKNITAEGQIITHSSFVGFTYNRVIANDGNWVYDPQGNATYAQTHPGTIAAPNAWPDGSIIGVLVNRVNDTAAFTLNGTPQGGPIDISGIGNQTIYPMAYSWFLAGPIATINGGTNGFAEALPTGYSALDQSGGGSTGSANHITVNQPSTLVIGQDTITGTETDPTQPVFLSWRSFGTPSVGDSDVVHASVDAKGNFTATVTVDKVGTQSTMYVGSSGVLTAAWSATPVAGSSGGGGGTGGGTTSTVTIGSGPDTLALQVSEDAYLGNAQFTVLVDGHQIGGTQTATASHAAGQTQTFNVLGTFAAGSHTATVDFLNDAYGGSPSTDRNLYVNSATIDGSVVSAATLTEHFPGPQSFSFLAPGTSGSGSGSTGDTVAVNRPAALIAGVQTITGTESDPSQSIFLDWRTHGVPVVGDSDWVQAAVNSSGSFSASMTIDNPGSASTMYYRIGSGPAVASWSGTPS